VDLLHNLNTEIRGYRPAEAIIDLPDQAALEFIANLTRLAAHRTRKKSIHDYVSSIEFVNLVKIGNNIKSTAFGRIAPKSSLLDGYLAIAGGPDRPTPYRNPLFRAALLLALLRNGNDRRWYEFMGSLLVERPWSFFVHVDDSPWLQSAFAADVVHKFASEWERYEKERKDNMALNQQPGIVQPSTPDLPLLIHRLVGKYVTSKAKDKCNLKGKKLKELSAEQRQKVYDEKRKYAADAFLAIRSRRDQDFVDYFTASICSVGQYFKTTDEFKRVADALLDADERDHVKTLTLLALSANS